MDAAGSLQLTKLGSCASPWAAFYSEMYEKLTRKVRFRQVVENDVLLPP